MRRAWMNVVLAMALCFVLVWAGPVSAANVSTTRGYTNFLDTHIFNNASVLDHNTTAHLTLVNQKTAFFVDWTESLANQSVTLVPQVSQDNVTFIDINFYDVAGGATPQTSEAITANGTYYFWLSDEVIPPYTRINCVSVNTTAAATATVSVYVVGSVGY